MKCKKMLSHRRHQTKQPERASPFGINKHQMVVKCDPKVFLISILCSFLRKKEAYLIILRPSLKLMWIAYAFMLFVTILKQFEEGSVYHIISILEFVARRYRKVDFDNMQTHFNNKHITSNTL